MALAFTFHADPGHGWLQVPKTLLISYGIADKISMYSYTDGPNVYLEEDCDAAIFENTLRDHNISFTLKYKYTENTPIRSMPHYTAP